LALAARLPTMSYGPNLTNLFRGAAEFVGKILRRVKPGDILVMQSSKFKLVHQLTNRAIGLEMPPTLLARADEVIE
jgi:putative tryptophan/tyrosine transport system substrate-binding protein